jgi:peptide chain release factor 3
VSPVFFGSALTNFGVEPFLNEFIPMSPAPGPRTADVGEIEPGDPRFSGFVFKIQANMDPNHRDRIAFLRVCSGKFVKNMPVTHVREQREIRLSKAHMFLAQERSLVEEAFPGDVVGLFDTGMLRIGDTLCTGKPMRFEGIPRFSPEHFVRVRLTDPLRRKQLKKGLDQLSEEGAVQLFFDRLRLERDPVLGAVGVLQFEVIQHRLKSEYGVSVGFDRLPYLHARWIEGGPVNLDKFERPGSTTSVFDVEGRPLVLFANDWAMRTAIQDNPQLQFIAAVQPGRGARPAA